MEVIKWGLGTEPANFSTKSGHPDMKLVLRGYQMNNAVATRPCFRFSRRSVAIKGNEEAFFIGALDEMEGCKRSGGTEFFYVCSEKHQILSLD